MLPLLGLGLAVLLTGGALLAWVQWGDSEPPPAAYIPLAADKSLGCNVDLSRFDATEREKALAKMETAGLRWVRQRFSWHTIEPERGIFDWTPWDGIVEDVSRHNLEMVAILDGAPVWARAGEDAENPLAPPVETRDFGDFVTAFVTRYGDRVDIYQLWDEPNIAPHWGAREIDPAAYARLLREGAIRVRAADPGAVILTAALAPTVEQGGANMSDLLFLDALYQQGAAEWFDVVAAQHYSFEMPIDAPPERNRLNWQRIALLRDVMLAQGDVETAVWAVSFGLTEARSDTVVDAVEQAREDWPWLGPMLWAAWSPGDVHGEYAPVGPEGQTGELLGAWSELAAGSMLAWPGVYPANHPNGHYEGDWRVAPSGADIGGSGDRLTIPFRGTRLDLMVRRGDYRAFLFVTVDGTPANALPHDPEGRAYVVLYDPLRQTGSVTLARNLPDGDHIAEIVAERGWGQWAIVGWNVSREAGRGWPWLPAALALAGVALLSVTAYKAWPFRRLLIDSGSVLVARYRAWDDRLVLAATAGAAILLYVMEDTFPTLVVVALGLLAFLLLLRPEMGLPLIALALPFYQPHRSLLGKDFSMVEILTLLATVGYAVNWGIGKLGSGESQGKQDAIRFTFLDWGVLALVVVGAASLLWSEHLREAAREFRTVVLEAGIFYALLRAVVRKRHEVWRVIDAWVLGATIIALVGMFQWAFGQNIITAEGVWRVPGFYGSPNNLALYLGKVFPLVVAVVAWGRKERRRWLYGLATLVMAVALFLTYSRGAWLVGVPLSLLFLAAMRGRRTLLLAVGVLLVAVVAIFVVVGTGRLTSLLDTSQGTTFFRLQLWQSSMAMIHDHPLLGVGLDNFLYAYRTHYVLPTAWEEFNLSHPHNFVLDFWLRLGLPGLLVCIWLLVGFFRRGWQAYRRLPEGIDRLLVLGLMGGMVNLMAHGLVDNAFFLVDLAFAFMLMLSNILS
jgi:O-antigen ligase